MDPPATNQCWYWARAGPGGKFECECRTPPLWWRDEMQGAVFPPHKSWHYSPVMQRHGYLMWPSLQPGMVSLPLLCRVRSLGNRMTARDTAAGDFATVIIAQKMEPHQNVRVSNTLCILIIFHSLPEMFQLNSGWRECGWNWMGGPYQGWFLQSLFPKE